MKSSFGDRETVGTVYLEAQKNNAKGLTIGEVGKELLNGLIEDLNDSIASNPFEDKPFYICVVEERDLQMKNAIKRRLFQTLYRPFPEDNTLVFHAEPKSGKVSVCWDLPHFSEFPNIFSNFSLYNNEYIQRIKDWLANDLTNFGFIKVSLDSSQVEGYDIKTINAYRKCYIDFLKSNNCDEKTIEVEKKLGFFWIPNKFYKDQICSENKVNISMIT